MTAGINRVALAFGLNIAAGLSTCIGGLVIFNKTLISITNPSRLGIALGVSAGVMIFISLAEIFEESVEHFQQAFQSNQTATSHELCKGQSNLTAVCNETCKGHSKTFATLCFLVGAAVIFLIDSLIHKIAPNVEHELNIDELSQLRQNAPEQENGLKAHIPTGTKTEETLADQATRESLNRTGILTALAIAIHNLPEGMATFIAALKDTRLGIALAISIALHNIPEGMAVAVPVYYATNSRWRAFLWTFVSALAEPLGGLICWAIVRDGLNPILNGVMFGLVVGMMVTISFKELIPTAYRFCPSKDKVTYAVLIGMSVMAVSLILFDYAGV